MVQSDLSEPARDKTNARGSSKAEKAKTLIAGICLGSGATLILDKLWWKHLAACVDNPLDHYGLGIFLIGLGVMLYKLAIPRIFDVSDSRS